MKKLLLATALIAFTSNAFAEDIDSALDVVNSKVIIAQEKVDAAKAKLEAAKMAGNAATSSIEAELEKAKSEVEQAKFEAAQAKYVLEHLDEFGYVKKYLDAIQKVNKDANRKDVLDKDKLSDLQKKQIEERELYN